MTMDENDRTASEGESAMADIEKTSVTETGTPNDELMAILRDGVVGAVGGLVGTALMTVVLLVGTAFGGFDPSSFATLAQLINLDVVGPALPIGYVIFLGGGMTTWPLLFASLERYLPGETIRQRGIPFGTVLWTGFVLAFYGDQTGIAFAIYIASTLIAHWAYGFGLGAVFDYLGNRPETLV